MAEPEAAPALGFPTDPSEFDADDRISYSKLDNKFIAVHDDGTEFEFDNQLRRWIPALDEEAYQQQQLAYGGGAGDDDDDDDDTSSHGNNKRRKRDDQPGGGGRSRKKQKGPPQPRQNTAVYVTGLPSDATVDEVHDVFSHKCGVVAEEIDSGRPRIKLYADPATGAFKGDALVVFFKPQSVEMAIMLLDDTDFRYTSNGLSSGKIRVQTADASYKKTNYEGDEAAAGAAEGRAAPGAAGAPATGAISTPAGGEVTDKGGNGAAGAKGRADHRAREQDKQKIIRRTQKLDAKLADWDDDDPYGGQLETNARRDRLVMLRHMFTLQELEEDPAALLEIKEDIRDECSKLGQVTNVVLYDLEEDGVASVKFRDPESAEACVRLMDGRAFDGRTVRASIATGNEKYRKSGKDTAAEED